MEFIRKGNNGQDVRDVQVLVNQLTPITPPMAEDGIFGPKTEQAVWRFQSENHLSADGIVGPQTVKALLERALVN